MSDKKATTHVRRAGKTHFQRAGTWKKSLSTSHHISTISQSGGNQGGQSGGCQPSNNTGTSGSQSGGNKESGKP